MASFEEDIGGMHVLACEAYRELEKVIPGHSLLAYGKPNANLFYGNELFSGKFVEPHREPTVHEMDGDQFRLFTRSYPFTGPGWYVPNEAEANGHGLFDYYRAVKTAINNVDEAAAMKAQCGGFYDGRI